MVALWHALQHPDYVKTRKVTTESHSVFNTINASKIFACDTQDKENKDGIGNIVNRVKEFKPTNNGVSAKHVDARHVH